MDKKSLFSLVLLFVVISGGAWYIYTSNQYAIDFYSQERADREALKLSLIKPNLDDITLGAEDPILELVVYTDTDCYFCRDYEPDLSELLQNHGDKVSLTYRIYDLPIYPYSRFEHHALACVGEISGPYQYRAFQNAELFENSFSGGEDHNAIVLESAKIYTPIEKHEELAACITDEKTTKKLKRMEEIAKVMGVTQTPTMFIVTQTNEIHSLSGNYSYTNLMKNLVRIEPKLTENN